MDAEQPTPTGARLCPLYCVLATDAAIAAVFQRHSHRWWRVLAWDVNKRTVSPGAWFRGQLHPRGASVSTCGTYLHYQARKPKRHPFWSAGRSAVDGYHAISKLPWLSALIAWRFAPVSGGSGAWEATWVTAHMLEQAGPEQEPDYRTSRVSSSHELLHRIREGKLIDRFPAVDNRHPLPYDMHRHYTNRGWAALDLAWSPIEPRQGYEFQLLGKPNPTGEGLLGFAWSAAIDEPGWLDIRQHFFVGTSVDDAAVLGDVNWAEWRKDGCLLTATKYGDLQIREVAGHVTTVVWETNIRVDAPKPEPAPSWATQL